VAVKLRLMRMGKKKQPTYRIVAADSRSPRDGRFIEIVGSYTPRDEPSGVLVENAKAVAWLDKGAQPTETVRKLLKISGAWEAYTTAHEARATKARAPRAKAKPAKKAASKKAAPKKAAARKTANKAASAVLAGTSDKDG